MPVMSDARLHTLTTALVPLLSKSLEAQFNVFRVMRHGTHEKQYSNVFAWLLDTEETHQLGDTFQRIFLGLVNEKISGNFPESGYRVAQEIDTSADPKHQDIADILLQHPSFSVVVENYHTSDGHGHGFERYQAFGKRGGRTTTVVLLCHRYEAHLQKDGWEQAVVVTYEELLLALDEATTRMTSWRNKHPRQHTFIQELIDHVVEGPEVVSDTEQITFLRAMCDSGEYLRYSQVDGAATFATDIAKYAAHQFSENNELLNRIRRKLATYASGRLVDSINTHIGEPLIGSVRRNYVGKYKSFVELQEAGVPNPRMVVGFVFGPTAAMYNDQLLTPLANPDFTKVFIRMKGGHYVEQDELHQTDVSLQEVIAGLRQDDTRLLEAALAVIPEHALEILKRRKTTP